MPRTFLPAPPRAAPHHPTAKAWWHSRTLWFNGLCAMLAAAEAGFGLLQPLLHVNAYAALAFALPLGNAVLRVLTTRPLGDTNNPQAPPAPP